MAKIALIAGTAESLRNFRGPLVEALLDRGHQVHALAPDPDTATLEWLNERGVTFHEIALNRTGLNPVRDIKTVWQIYRCLTSVKPDACISYTIKPVIYGTLAAFLARVPKRAAMITGLGYAFIEDDGGYKRRLTKLVASTLYKLALARAYRVVFQNPDDRAYFLNHRLVREPAKTAIVNGSGVDVSHFGNVALPGIPVFLLIARLLKDKGIHEYIAAARLVRTALPDGRFLLAGPEDVSPNAIDQAVLREAEGDGTIDYLGSLDDVRPALADCSVYVLPSYREGTPRSVLEAMAMGRPIVTTDAPGCRETVIDGENGFLVPVKTTRELADAMIKLGSDEKLRNTMGERSRKLVEEKYEAGLVAEQTIKACGLD